MYSSDLKVQTMHLIEETGMLNLDIDCLTKVVSGFIRNQYRCFRQSVPYSVKLQAALQLWADLSDSNW